MPFPSFRLFQNVGVVIMFLLLSVYTCVFNNIFLKIYQIRIFLESAVPERELSSIGRRRRANGTVLN